MNTNLVTIIKQIITDYGEAVLSDPQRLKAFFSDLAKDEPKPLRVAFGRCIEEGAYEALKTAPDKNERAERKATIAQRVRDEHGLDITLCSEALDILEAALYGVQSTVPPSKPPIQQPQYTPPKPPEVSPYIPPQSGATPTAANAVRTESVAKNNKPPIAALIAVSVAVIAAITVFALWSMNVAEKERERQRIVQEQQRIEAEKEQERQRIAQEQERERQRLEFANMVRINGGTFTMGSPTSEPDRSNGEVQHSVTVGSFYMGKYEVTQKEWREVMGNNPTYFKGDDLPVEQVSWYDAVEYCNKRSQREGLAAAYTISGTNVTWNKNANGYRLPTEAEWEYACRAGITTPFSTGNNITTSQANYNGNYPYNGNAKGTYRERTTPVGSFAPNAWGLYDMHGNVWEWCWDWYGDYAWGAQTNPMGAGSGSFRVFRGGSGDSSALGIRSAYRLSFPPAIRSNFVGFRLARSGF
jgi:formylglycine-generating enzyme required for sulfatase activity